PIMGRWGRAVACRTARSFRRQQRQEKAEALSQAAFSYGRSSVYSRNILLRLRKASRQMRSVTSSHSFTHLSPEPLMSGVSAVVLIKAETSLINELAEQLVELPGVAEVFSVAGQYDLVALVRVRENEDLAEVISHQMRKLQGILGTQTLIAF